jgi:H/ACA ribonucleoprotein complex subunit 1
VTIRTLNILEQNELQFRGRCGCGGGFRGRGGGGGRGLFRGGRVGRGRFDPERIVLMGNIAHACQEDLVVKSSIDDVPYFNASIDLKEILCFG